MADDIDDEVCDSWEEMLDNTILEERLKKMKPQLQDPDEKDEICRGEGVYLGPVILQEESGRTQYMPPEPHVKILKRPSSANQQDCTSSGGGLTLVVNGDRSAKQPVKTLQQREAEYAEARLRILGSAKSDEEVAEERMAKLGIGQSCEIAIRGVQLALPSELSTVVRQPKGPDGTQGFAFKR